MKDYEVTIKSNSVSVKAKEFKEMIDPDTNKRVRIPVSAHRKVIGLGDFKGDALKYKQAVKVMLEEPYGKGFSELVSRIAALEQELDVEKVERLDLEQLITRTLNELEDERSVNAALEKELTTMENL